ncbi:DNA replication endonuclease-helicase Dna2 [Schizosaccharomyces japonicus yFS275]|uniref:DNA replication ATP-dependent helicase/nuclease n=1 Tax=Schizosaccharomyces japonicus (strain yFS275 / FY16936) TaxID=402676 RepID=B6K655_SCHJY|nr:DNA replication endonuclease-helicase Dna2 [Schizosaccharomyces japonicus yFS275]EEB09009.2 DNA replication endonuclease-helicase Dna2 [Schizosaccharomyces japonicus yFS275]
MANQNEVHGLYCDNDLQEGQDETTLFPDNNESSFSNDDSFELASSDLVLLDTVEQNLTLNDTTINPPRPLAISNNHTGGYHNSVPSQCAPSSEAYDDGWDFSSLPNEVEERLDPLFLVIETREEYEEKNDYSFMKKVILLTNIVNRKPSTAILLDEWSDTPVRTGDSLAIYDASEIEGDMIVSNSNGYIIMFPFYLLSATSVADSFTCLRRATFKEWYGSTHYLTKPIVYGNILHRVFQNCLRDPNEFTGLDKLDALLRNSIKLETVNIHFAGLTNDQCLNELRERLPAIRKWMLSITTGDERQPVLIKALIDTEESILSYRFGLKGNIDATVEASITGMRPSVYPLELKTGKVTNTTSHFAQALMYTLLMSEKSGSDIQNALLAYLETSTLTPVKSTVNKLRGIIIARNRLISSIWHHEIPPIVGNVRTCQRCYLSEECFTYNEAFKNEDSEIEPIQSLYQSKLETRDKKDIEFLRKWDRLLLFEEKIISKCKFDMYFLSAEEKEERGDCVNNLKLTKFPLDRGSSLSKRYLYSFFKDESIRTSLNVGDHVLLSSTNGKWTLAKGVITYMERNQVDTELNQFLSPTILNKFNSGDLPFPETDSVDALFRIDKDEYTGGLSLIRSNILKLCILAEHESLRRLIIHLDAPSFTKHKTKPASVVMEQLNSDQRKAIDHVLCADDYALILGMPGTGKTTTIACLIHTLVSNGKSVLLSSYTHTAVDNILLKLKQFNFPILRLGSKSKVLPEVFSFCFGEHDTASDDITVKKIYEEPLIVATSCLGIQHPLFSKRKFDYCLIDEASQIPLPVCLGPLENAHKFVLIGDHYQLAPLVKSSEATENGLGLSLFKLLTEAHPEAVSLLRLQYRMNEDIVSLSNKLIYGGMLQCGSQKTALKRLHISDTDPQKINRLLCSVKIGNSNLPWLHKLLDPAKSVLFFDTDGCSASETKNGRSIENIKEADFIFNSVLALTVLGLEQKAIGVITIYRSQVYCLRRVLSDFPEVEINTADKYQGRDKDVILLSFVRSNPNDSVGELLKDWKRINVILTRAKTKCIMFGSKKTLSSATLFRSLFSFLEEKGWLYLLKEDIGADGTVLTATTNITEHCFRNKKRELKVFDGENVLLKKSKLASFLVDP